jgi:hypothetical protein
VVPANGQGNRPGKATAGKPSGGRLRVPSIARRGKRNDISMPVPPRPPNAPVAKVGKADKRKGR